MRVSKVPIDMSSEQKNILGVVSTRQLIYIGVGTVICYSYVPLVFTLLYGFIGWVAAAVICLITVFPVAFVIVYFGFMKVSKLNMNRDYWHYIKFQRKTQYGKWHKGR